MLVAGEGTNENLSTWPRAAAAQQSSESERVARERERRTRSEEGMQRTERGNGMQVMHRRREKKNARASCGPFFSVSMKISVFFYFSFSPF